MDINELEIIRDNTLKYIQMDPQVTNKKVRIAVGMATCGIAAGAEDVYNALVDQLEKSNISNVDVISTGCIGICKLEPVMEVIHEDGRRVVYVDMTADKARKIIENHIKDDKICMEYTIGEALNKPGALRLQDIDFFSKQFRIALRNCGVINPESINEYIAMDGYKALAKVLTEMKTEEVVDFVKKSSLRGRGGAGFPTGVKWDFAAKQEGPIKYVCCNADEGDPGAFMDRSVLEGDPHALLEAMTIAGYAIGSNQGYIYVRAEYPLAVKRLQIAIKQAKDYGLLGKNIFETNFDFDIELRLGAGAFVCGEETALMTSIEGKRGEPRPRPPFPAVKGLWGKPSILNNVETYANIPTIFNKGLDWFRSIGTEKSKGTKVFAVGGKISTTGLVEVPIGTTVREIVFDICGGIADGKEFKAAQTGGPSGGCIPKSHLDTPVDYETLTALGSMMGSGGLIVMDEDTCMVDLAKFFLEFTVDESCGKCPPCRVGTKRMLEILEKITDGRGEEKDIKKLETLATSIRISALCGLGQTAPNPVISTLMYFRDEYIAHVTDKKCSAGVCKALLGYIIDASLCKKCGICAKNCPAKCIDGDRNTGYTIDSLKCIKCGECLKKCPFNAVKK